MTAGATATLWAWDETGEGWRKVVVDNTGRLRIVAEIDHLNDIGDVTITAVADGEFISWSDGLGVWQNRALADGDIPDLDADKIVSGTLDAARLSANIKTLTITFIIDGGGAEIALGEHGHLEIPFACTIQRVTMLADQAGSIVVDIWKDTYANFPPTNADSITAAAPPTIAGPQKSQDSTLTGWTTAIAAGDILAFNVDSVTDIERVTISLKVVKT